MIREIKLKDEEQWKKFQEGIEQFLLNVSNSIEDETMTFTVQNLTVSQYDSSDDFSILLPLYHVQVVA